MIWVVPCLSYTGEAESWVSYSIHDAGYLSSPNMVLKA